MTIAKTQPTENSVADFIESLDHEQRKQDSRLLLKIFDEITGEPAVLWGSAIIGYGSYHYTYASGREGDWMKTGFSPRKSSMSIYLMNGYDDYQQELKQLGKHSVGKSCLVVKNLEDIDLDILRKMLTDSYAWMCNKYG